MKKEILHLLQERNNCLSQFAQLNLNAVKKFKDYNYEDINSFYTVREGLLEMVSKIEAVISIKLAHKDLTKSDLTPEFKAAIDDLLKEKDEIVKEILDQDLNIMSMIEKEKARIYNKIQAMKKGRKVITSYKSGLDKTR